MNKNIQFKIQITENYQLKCSVIDITNKEIPIELNNKDNKEINFIKDIITEPQNYKLYSIQIQQKEYNVIAEVLLALLIDEFKQKIEKEYVITTTIVEISEKINKQNVDVL